MLGSRLRHILLQIILFFPHFGLEDLASPLLELALVSRRFGVEDLLVHPDLGVQGLEPPVEVAVLALHLDLVDGVPDMGW